MDLNNPASWDLHLTETEAQNALEQLSPLGADLFIALSVGTKNSANDWEHHNWSSLCQRIATQHPKLQFVFLGAPDEAERSTTLLNDVGGRGLNLCGKTSPRVAAAILSKARMFVGHDSGPMHLAACVGTACIGLFSARNPPGIWYPRGGTIRNRIHYKMTDCYGCGLVECIEEKKRCILSITVDEVIESVRELMTRS